MMTDKIFRRPLVVGILVFVMALLAVGLAGWALSVAPGRGWDNPASLSLIVVLGLLLSMVLAVLTAMLTAALARVRGKNVSSAPWPMRIWHSAASCGPRWMRCQTCCLRWTCRAAT